MTPQLCLGTVQFGLAYGATNATGQVGESEVAEILEQAHQAKICWLDTAQAYGNAEAVLGRNMPISHGFKIISKLQAQDKEQFSSQDTDVWEHAFRETCLRLRVHGLEALLLHSPSDLIKPGAQYLMAWLMDLRERGLIKRIGVSIYAAEELELVNPALLDLVQLPLSLFDQRLLQDGTLARLRAAGTAIHARSLFLQGLLVTSAAQWPKWASPKLRAHQHSLEVFAKAKGCTLIDLALGFARQQMDLEALVLGLCSVNELSALLEAWSATSPWQGDEWRNWALNDPAIMDPRRWPR